MDGRRPSYWHQVGSGPLLPLTVGKVLDDAADRWPDRIAVFSKYQNISYTFIEIRHRVNDFAAGLLRLGLAPGDRLAIWGHNSSQWHCAYLAATSIGIIVAKLDPAATPKEVVTNLTKIEPRAIVCAEYYGTNNCVEAVAQIRSQLGNPLVIVISDKHYPNTVRFQDVSSEITSQVVNKVQELKQLVQPDCGCDIIFTSGTTGHPKGALLSHHAILNGMIITGTRGQYNNQVGRWCVMTQFCHMSATYAILSCICFGMTLVIPGAVYDADQVVSTIIEEQCTNALAIPSQCVDLIQIARQRNIRIPHMKHLLISGAPVSAALVHGLKKHMESVNVLAAFGMTESSGMTFVVSPDDDVDQASTTVGRVLDHIEVKILDTEGRMVPMGTPGELWVRGYCNMLGYWGQPDKTQEVKQEDGWLKTGDQFVLTEGGYGRVVGRLKEMIIRENVNIFPLEIEHFLQSHPDVLDVQAFGVPDPKVTEEMCVYIRTKHNVPLTAQDIRNFCKGQIADWKIPRYIIFVEDFPRSAAGKVAKQKLKKMALEQLGLSTEENLLYVPGVQ